MTAPDTQLTNNEIFIEDIPNAFYHSIQTDSPILIYFKENFNDPIPLENISKFQNRLIIVNLIINSTQFHNFKRLFPNYFKFYEIENYDVLLLNNNDITKKWKISQYESSHDIQQYLEDYLLIKKVTGTTSNKIELRRNYKQNELKRIKSLIHQDEINRHKENSVIISQHKMIKDNILFNSTNNNNNNNNNNECTLRIKLNDSSIIEHTFNSCTDSLSTVKKYIEIVTGNKIPSDVSFHKVLPKRRYNNQEELQSLNSLDLLPRSSLYLLKNKEYIRELRRHRDSSQDLKYIFFFIEKFKKVFQFMHFDRSKSFSKNKNITNNFINSKSYVGNNNLRRDRSFAFNDHLP